MGMMSNYIPSVTMASHAFGLAVTSKKPEALNWAGKLKAMVPSHPIGDEWTDLALRVGIGGASEEDYLTYHCACFGCPDTLDYLSYSKVPAVMEWCTKVRAAYSE